MPVHLLETFMDLGSYGKRQQHVLGDPAVAEKLIEWSKTNKAGTSIERKTVWGLTLRAVATGANPQVHLLLNTKVLGNFLQQLGPITLFGTMEYGISLMAPSQITDIAVPGHKAHALVFIEQPEENIELFHFDPSNEREDSLLVGAIKLTEEGFIFSSLSELQEAITRLEEEAMQAGAEEEDFVIVEDTPIDLEYVSTGGSV